MIHSSNCSWFVNIFFLDRVETISAVMIPPFFMLRLMFVITGLCCNVFERFCISRRGRLDHLFGEFLDELFESL